MLPTVLALVLGLCIVDAKAAEGRFRHPGIGLNREQLDQLKANVQGGVEPWKSLFDDLTNHHHAFTKTPRIFARRGEGITLNLKNAVEANEAGCFSRKGRKVRKDSQELINYRSCIQSQSL